MTQYDDERGLREIDEAHEKEEKKMLSGLIMAKKQKTNEQIACNNWEKIGMMKGRKQAIEEFYEKIKQFIDGYIAQHNWIKLSDIELIKKEMLK